MTPTQIFFVILSAIILVYLFSVFRSNKRMPIIIELFFGGAFTVALLLFLFPQIVVFVERTLNIDSAINFMLYLAVFVLFLLCFYLYRRIETQRTHITKLMREISFLKK